MKRKHIFIGLFLTFLFINPANSQNILGKEITISDKSNYICGFSQLVDLETELKNTQLLHPEIFGNLKKSSKVTSDVGDTLEFYTSNFVTNSREKISAVCRLKSQKTYIFVGLEEWSSEKVVQQDVDNFHEAFEISTPSNSIDPNKGIREIEETTFGPPPNKGGNGYVYILIHDIKDDYGEGNSTSYVAGYFSPTDQSNIAISNKKDLIYVDCDPSNPSGSFVLSVVAHEFQHLIHYGLDGNEVAWVNEGASEYAEVLCGYSLRDPSRYLRSPDRPLTSFQYGTADALLDYSKVALWTYYLAEKFGNSLIGDIVRNTSNSIEGIQRALNQQGITLSVEQIFSNFVVANYADNPAIGDQSYFGYININMPTLPNISNTHNVYPVDQKENSLPSFTSAYYRFKAPDSTAILRFDATPASEILPQIFTKGDIDNVTEMALETDNSGGFYRLKEIGKTASEIIMIPTSLGTNSSYKYYVTSQINDVTPPQITSGPNESLPTGNSVTIFWETDELGTSIVEYGKSTDYTLSVVDTNLVSFHQVSLGNLSANTMYHYRIGSVDNKGNGPAYSIGFSFTTSTIESKVVVSVRQSHSYGYEGRNLVRSSTGSLHLLYHELVDNRRFVFHITTEDNGENWSQPVVIDNSNFYGGMPSVAIDSLNRLHVAWHAQKLDGSNYNIYYCRSEDLGISWTNPILVSKIFTTNDQLYAAIAVDQNNNPHIVWNTVVGTESNIGDVHYNFSQDGGTSWPNDKMISNSNDHRCFVPTIDFTSDGKAWVFYVDGDFDQNTRKAYFVNSNDYQLWSSPQAATTSGILYDSFVSFAVDYQDQIHLVYADNYSPGDIRIMYTKYSAGFWKPPIPVAKSITGGNVSYPNIAVDENNDIYLVYRDDMETGSLGKLMKKSHIIDSPNLKKTMAPTDKGDTFLAINRKDNWIPATNISNDNVNSEYPELPANINNGIVDLIWMSEVSTSTNRINHIHLNTKSAPNLTPPQISTIHPEDSETGIPYFKQVFKIIVEFDQRIEADSLIPDYVIIKNSSNESIVGEISYLESKRQMKFTPLNDLPADDLITITLTSKLTNGSGVGLDGNKNGISEGSPIDDFTWTFRTQPQDTQAPTFTIGILQNPILTKYMDIYLVASEQLAENPTLKIGSLSIPLSINNAEANIYKGDYKLNQNGALQIEASGKDWGGNNGNGSKSFSAQLMLADQGGSINSSDGNLFLSLSPGSMQNDTYFTIVEKEEQNSSSQKTYQVGPSSISLIESAVVEFQIPDKSKQFQLEQKSENGSWVPISSEVNVSILKATIHSLGEIRLVETGDFIPTEFTLQQNYPNPFSLKSKQTVFTYELPQKETIEIVIYNILGAKIITLTNSEQEPGIYQINWNGKDDQNRLVASGVYFYQLKTQNKVFTKKMLILQ
jgi:hypothetical protein